MNMKKENKMKKILNTKAAVSTEYAILVSVLLLFGFVAVFALGLNVSDIFFNATEAVSSNVNQASPESPLADNSSPETPTCNASPILCFLCTYLPFFWFC